MNTLDFIEQQIFYLIDSNALKKDFEPESESERSIKIKDGEITEMSNVKVDRIKQIKDVTETYKQLKGEYEGVLVKLRVIWKRKKFHDIAEYILIYK